MVKNHNLKNTFNKIIVLCYLLVFGLQIGNSQSQIRGNWRNVKIGGGGFVTGIVASQSQKDLFYARTDIGGAYRWDQNKEEWTPLLDWVTPETESFQGVESIALDPNNPEKVYMAVGLSGYGWTGASFLISNDYGAHFDIVPSNGVYIHGNGMGRQTGEKLMVDPNESKILYFGSRKDGLLKSEDFGRHWNKISSFPAYETPNLNGICFVLIDKNSGAKDKASQRLLAGISRLGENIYLSSNAGMTWETIVPDPTAVSLMPQHAVLSEDGTTLFVTYSNGAGPHPQTWDGVDEKMNRGAVFKYHFPSKTWTNISPIDLLVGTEYVGSFGGLTTSGGKLYVSTLNHWNQRQEYADGEEVAYGDRLFFSNDKGQTWKALFDGDEKLKLSSNGINWIKGLNLHWTGCITLDPFDSNRLFAVSGNGIFMSKNIEKANATMGFTVKGLEETVGLDLISIPGGPLVSVIGDYDGFVHNNVDEYPIGKRHTPSIGTSTGLAFSEQNGSIIARAGSSGKVLYYSQDTGKTWTGFDHLPIPATNGKLAISTLDGATIVAWIPETESDKFYITSNFGKTWTNLWVSSNGSIQNAQPLSDPKTSGLFYVYSKVKGKLFKLQYFTNARPETTELATIGGSGSQKIVIDPYEKGTIWCAMQGNGLLKYANGQIETFSNINAYAVSIGPPFLKNDPPTIFVWGEVRGVLGMYRSTDNGKIWYRINDETHMYGGLGGGNQIVADRNIFGRVYMTTAGRGIAVGDSGFDTLYIDPIDISTSTEQIGASDLVYLYPNPTSDYAQVNLPSGITNYTLFDSNGKLLRKDQISTDRETLDFSYLQSGIYFIIFGSHNGTFKQYAKIVKM